MFVSTLYKELCSARGKDKISVERKYGVGL